MHKNITFYDMKLVIDTKQTGIACNVYRLYFICWNLFGEKISTDYYQDMDRHYR